MAEGLGCPACVATGRCVCLHTRVEVAMDARGLVLGFVLDRLDSDAQSEHELGTWLTATKPPLN